jgi:mono/diheme cytochrome c family protein
MKLTRFLFVYLFLISASIIAFLASCESQQTKTEMTEQQMLERGKILITVGDCDVCHTPKKFGPNGPELDMTRRFSGRTEGMELAPVDTSLLHNWGYLSHDLSAFVGPWGISFPANLTPDNETGIGTWQAEMFINAIRIGKHLGVADGRPILPPMPTQNLAQLSDEDLKAMFMYLKSMPAVKNKVPDPLTPNQIPVKQ